MHHNAIHGMFGTPTYNSWAAMKQRCYYKNAIGYHQYGGKGIRVCDEWMTFEGFLKDMGIRPPGKTLDRIDYKGNYEKSNCRWATALEQANNVSTNRVITFNNKTQSISNWAREYGLPGGYIIAKRLKRGWSVEDALTKPQGFMLKEPGGKETQFKPTLVTYKGVTRSITEWAEHLGFSNGSALGKRLARGLPLSVALTPPRQFMRKRLRE